jgi:hypothetical protein
MVRKDGRARKGGRDVERRGRGSEGTRKGLGRGSEGARKGRGRAWNVAERERKYWETKVRKEARKVRKRERKRWSYEMRRHKKRKRTGKAKGDWIERRKEKSEIEGRNLVEDYKPCNLTSRYRSQHRDCMYYFWCAYNNKWLKGRKEEREEKEKRKRKERKGAREIEKKRKEKWRKRQERRKVPEQAVLEGVVVKEFTKLEISEGRKAGLAIPITPCASLHKII